MGRGRTNGQKQFFEDLDPEGDSGTYQPLPSIWDGTDAELLERFLDFYPRKRPKRILDATVNSGRFWVRSNRNVIGLDIERKAPACRGG